jgi:hypothetical protein
MFVIERSGVHWDQRFYSGHDYLNNTPNWASRLCCRISQQRSRNLNEL